MKNIGIILLAVGVGLAAASGAQNPPDIHEDNVAAGQATFLGAAADEAFAAYCEALEAAELDARDGCPEDDAAAERPGDAADDADDEAGAEPADGESAAGESAADDQAASTYGDLVAAGAARVAELRRGGQGLPADVTAAREAWVDAVEAAYEPAARAATTSNPTPGARLSAWFGAAGIPFVIGLALVIVGAVIARRASHTEAGMHEGDDERGPVDFGALLGELSDDVHALADEARRRTSPGAEDFEAVKARVEELQAEKLTRLIGARVALERRHGLATYAAIFSPLSAGERMLNRCWAALSDRHWPEATTCLDAASEAFASAKKEVPADG